MEKTVGIVDNRAFKRIDSASRKIFLNNITILQQFCNNYYRQSF